MATLVALPPLRFRAIELALLLAATVALTAEATGSATLTVPEKVIDPVAPLLSVTVTVEL
jgi:hypothetical protein